MLGGVQPVTISDRAIAEIKNIMSTKGIPGDYGLRLGIKGGGCSATLIIGFDKRKDSDLTYLINGVTVYIDKAHTLFLVGKEVDFFEGEDARGFLFKESTLNR
jgi:iron-sulfur cluster assembly protein